ncbi:MAG: nuclear transport factor 2 family protein [Saprospiraceae bacterium]|nr:nuclear transport factor 2 family protein [Saprospiraceae bacterium]
MKHLYMLLFLAPALSATAQSKSDRAVLDTELRRFEAMTRRDTAALRDLLTDDLFYLHSNALQENKTTHLGAIASGRIVYEKMNREQATVRRYGRTALVNGIVGVSGKLNQSAFEIRLAYSALYRKKCGKWRLANWQSTRLL